MSGHNISSVPDGATQPSLVWFLAGITLCKEIRRRTQSRLAVEKVSSKFLSNTWFKLERFVL